MHAGRVDGQDDGLATPGTDDARGPRVGGQVDVAAPLPGQPLGEDARQEPLDRSVVEHGRRRGRGEPQVDRDGVALRGPDRPVAYLEPALVRTGDDPLQQVRRDGAAVPGERVQQCADLDPAGAVELDAHRVGPVPQHVRQEPAHPDLLAGHQATQKWSRTPETRAWRCRRHAAQ